MSPCHEASISIKLGHFVPIEFPETWCILRINHLPAIATTIRNLDRVYEIHTAGN